MLIHAQGTTSRYMYETMRQTIPQKFLHTAKTLKLLNVIYNKIMIFTSIHKF